jgi:hypothetical protein
MHSCILPRRHDGEHVCICGERAEQTLGDKARAIGAPEQHGEWDGFQFSG